MADIIQVRRDTAANWTSANPVLADGEIGYEKDTQQIKVGDGTTAWNSLDYGGIHGPQGEQGIQGVQGPAGSLTAYSGMDYHVDADGTMSGTWAIDYDNGPVVSATAGGNVTSITVSNWPTTGTAGHLKLLCTNFGAYTITFPTAWKFTKTDMTVGAFADLGITLPASGTVIFDLVTIDAGTNVYVTLARN